MPNSTNLTPNSDKSLAHYRYNLIANAILLALAVGLIINMITSDYPATDHGFTSRNWKPTIKESLFYAIPFLFLYAAIKWILVQVVASMEGRGIYDFFAPKEQRKNNEQG